jgi:hypothetical protein
MSKAKERALRAYPVKIAERDGYDENLRERKGFVNGYHQAEIDKELTWEDMREIYCITLNLRQHLGASVFGEPLYQEVLKLFKEWKEK